MPISRHTERIERWIGGGTAVAGGKTHPLAASRLLMSFFNLPYLDILFLQGLFRRLGCCFAHSFAVPEDCGQRSTFRFGWRAF